MGLEISDFFAAFQSEKTGSTPVWSAIYPAKLMIYKRYFETLFNGPNTGPNKYPGLARSIADKGGLASDDFQRHGGGHRQRGRVHQGTELRRLARPCAKADVDRRQDDSRADHQARQQLPAHTLRPGRPLRPDASGELAQARLRPLAGASGTTTAPQCSRHGLGQ